MPRSLTINEQTEAAECFSIFAKNEKLPASELGVVLRSLGYTPTNAEVNHIISKNKLKDISFSILKEILQQENLSKTNTEDELKEAFGIFDRDGNGTVSMAELRHILTCSGEKLTDEEITEIINNAQIDNNGYLHYTELVHKIVKQ